MSYFELENWSLVIERLCGVIVTESDTADLVSLTTS